jgi:hypothetical protein
LTSVGNATPIKPDLKKLLTAPPGSNVQFAPARAGWNGPEAPTASQANMNPELARITPAAARLEWRNSIMNALVPDPRITAAILITILFLRRWILQQRQLLQPHSVSVEEKQQLRPAA